MANNDSPEPGPGPGPTPTPIMTSRSVRLAMIACSPVLFAILLAELAIFVAMVRGRTTLEIGIGLMFGGVLTGSLVVIPAFLKIAEGWTRQDEAKINASAPKAPVVQVATGDNSSATSTNIAAPSVTAAAPVTTAAAPAPAANQSGTCEVAAPERSNT